MPSLLSRTVLLVALGLAGCDNSVDQTIPDPLATPAGWALVWADEFDGAALDDTKWTLQLGDGCPDLCGWGNNELQVYTPDNHTVGDGVLTITAREGADGTYTSTRMNTEGKGDWTYGRYEIRAKLPTGQGLWPAIWMFFSDDTYGGWAASGEIDIMENIGSRPSEVFGTLHYGGPFPDNVFSGDEFRLAAGTFADDFFVFAIEWEEGEIRWYVNNVLFQTQTSDDWFTTGSDDPAAPFDHPFHLLLNVAVGGNLPGSPDESTVFPQTMQVDYVRVYEREG
ncbi:family 16 glycosylhydrolase [Rubrivirga sp. IMCC45206]|uniref:glycoside hydrolase family 16 protein n=1 Tax=Rubrivirga sp. IMCC45206 TaxID=3391614 RepID=UPI00398FD076